MKTIYSFISGLTLIVLLLCSCVDDCIINEYNGYISVDVSDDGGNTTRTAYSGLTTTFENGDAIGIYVVDGSGTVQASNVQYTKSGDSWTSSTPLSFNPDWKYYAYFPYVATPYTPDFTASGIDNQFDDFITDASDKFHYADQSTKANFMASDLMVAQGELTGSSGFHFSMDHKKGLAVLEGEGATITSYEGNIPYINGGKGYFLMKANTATTIGDYSLTAQAGRYVEQDVPIDYSKMYLTFEALVDGTFSFSKAGLSYSLDGGTTWTALDAGVSTPMITAGQKVMWKNNTELTPTSSEGIGNFSATGYFNAEGNIMSLLFGDNFIGQLSLSGKDYALCYVFGNNKKIKSAKDMVLPATTLSDRCYDSMFAECENITTVPELPATTMASYCYDNMFYRCTNLEYAPDLPATTLASGCYSGMFNLCTHLTTAPELPATKLETFCYKNMFQNCYLLTMPPELPATTLANYCYYYMFDGCTNLRKTPTLSATLLRDYCYYNMFSRCTSLTIAPKLPATTLTKYCYTNMFNGCSSLTTVPSDMLPATTLANNCYQQMFQNCSSLSTAPELPAISLVSGCYYQMFNKCTNLNYIKAAFTTTPGSTYTQNWVKDIAASGTFVKNSDAAWNVTGASGVPSGWTVQTYTPTP
jgi:hypothetical protein